MLIFRRESDARTGDPAIDSHDARLQHQIVHAGKDGVASADGVMQFGTPARIARAFLERDEVLHVGEFDKYLRRGPSG